MTSGCLPESSLLPHGRELDAINQAQNEQKTSPPYRSVQVGQYRVRGMRPLGQSTGKNQKPVNQQEHPYKEPNLNDAMFFAHLASPENDLKNQQDREGRHSPKERSVQKTRVLFFRDFRQRINKAFQFLVRPRLGYKGRQNGDNYTSDAGPQCLVHVLREPLRMRRQCKNTHPAMIQFHQRKHSDGRKRSRQQAHETSGAAYPLPKHSEQYGAEQRRDEEAEQRLHVIHDAGKAHRQIGGSDAHEQANQRAPASHGNVMLIGRRLAQKWTIDVIRPYRGKGAHVASHARHEPGDQRGDAEAQQAGPAIAGEHEGEHLVVTVLPGLQTARRNQVHRQDGEPQQPRENHDQGHSHLEKGTDDRRHLGGPNVLRRKNALHDKEVSRPIAHRLHRSEAEHNAGPVHAHRIILKAAKRAPGVRVILTWEILLNARDHPLPSTRFDQTKDGNEERTEPDQEKLQNFVEDGGEKPSGCNVYTDRQR